MPRDHFAILGLEPGQYDAQTVARQFIRERERLRLALLDPRQYAATRERLDQLYVAYAALRDPVYHARYARMSEPGADRVTKLRRMINESLEDGLLRQSRRQAVLERASELGLSEFQAQLIIAQVQFGDGEIHAAVPKAEVVARGEHPRMWARAAAAGVLALAMFLYMVHWVGN